MSEPVSASDSWMNEKTNLNYTVFFGQHADETAAQVLQESLENLSTSEEILAQSRAELRRAQNALANMELQNLMAQFSHYTAAQKQAEAFRLFWSDCVDVALSFPGFAYAGREAIQGYLLGLKNRRIAKLEELKANYEAIQVCEDLAGAGYSDCRCLCTPYIVVAGDGQTAQGVWNLMRMASEELGGRDKKLSSYWFERWHVDFVREKDAWKLWHLTVREDLREFFDEDQLPPGPMQLRLPRTGGNSPPGNINMPGGMPFMPGGKAKTLTAPKTPTYPQAYESFAYDSLLDGVTRARNDVGTVPESMLHLPFADAQEMGPPKTDKGGPAKEPAGEKGGGAK